MSAAVTAGVEAKEPSATSVLRTLVLCDLVDSTALVERLGDQHAAELFRRHDRFARALVHQHGGREIDKTDGFLLMFDRPIEAVAFALAYQRGLRQLGDAGKRARCARASASTSATSCVWDNAPDDVQRAPSPSRSKASSSRSPRA